jgi:hypothetical protein
MVRQSVQLTCDWHHPCFVRGESSLIATVHPQTNLEFRKSSDDRSVGEYCISARSAIGNPMARSLSDDLEGERLRDAFNRCQQSRSIMSKDLWTIRRSGHRNVSRRSRLHSVGQHPPGTMYAPHEIFNNYPTLGCKLIHSSPSSQHIPRVCRARRGYIDTV